MITFDEWCANKGVKLKPWQRKAVEAFLKEMAPHKAPQTGKSFMVRVLHSFVDECGNRFALTSAEQAAERKKRGHEEKLPGETL